MVYAYLSTDISSIKLSAVLAIGVSRGFVFGMLFRYVYHRAKYWNVCAHMVQWNRECLEGDAIDL
jgi:uncharacterized membrane-anchored protein